jgi:hypothetical protein
MITTETFSAVVTNNKDDEERGRIRVACTGLLGDDDSDLPMWVEPILDWGWFYVPDIGEIIEIEVVSGSDIDEQQGQCSIDNLDIKWRGQRYYGNSKAEEPTVIHSFFSGEHYGKKRGFSTPFGHVVMFDDSLNAPKITITWTSVKQSTEDTEISQVIIDTDGTISLKVLGKNTLHLKENEIELTLDEGAALKITGKDADSTTILGDGGVKAAIADHLETFYGSLKSYIESAQVATAMGPSGTILAQMGPAPTWDSNINSTKLTFPDG